MTNIQKITGKRGSYRVQFMKNGCRIGQTFNIKSREAFMAQLTFTMTWADALTPPAFPQSH